MRSKKLRNLPSKFMKVPLVKVMTPETVQFPQPRELTEEQKQYWEHQLEIAERARQYALRMLGRISLDHE